MKGRGIKGEGLLNNLLEEGFCLALVDIKTFLLLLDLKKA
jgi:hypothetical protein